MDSFRSNHHILGESDLSLIYDDDKLIEDAITTPYEKVLKILSNVKHFIESIKEKVKMDSRQEISQKEMVRDLDWVIKRIQSHSLYTYELIGETEDLEKMSEESPEIKSFLQFLSDYSEGKGYKRAEKSAFSQTTKLKERPVNLPYGGGNKPFNTVDKEECNTTTNKGRNFLAGINEGNLFKIHVSKIEENKEEKKESSRSNIIIINAENSTDKLGSILDTESKGIISKKGSDTPNKNKKDYGSVSPLEGIVRMKKSSSKQTPTIINTIPIPGNIDKDKNKESVSGIQNISNISGSNNMSGLKLNLTSLSNLNIQEDKGGIFFDVKKISTGNSNSNDIFKNNLIKENFEVDVKAIMNKDFNIHEFDVNVGRPNVLPLIGKTILSTLGLTEIINNDKLDNFLRKISAGYFESVQYHNSVHAADVAQTISTYLLNSNLEVITLLNQSDILSLIIAALGHDIGHPGTNNGFHINTYSDIAITYNDQSVLENFHSSLLFKILRQEENNILDKFPDSSYKTLRKRIINLILSTDMSQHAKVISILKPKVLEYKETLSKLNQEGGGGSTHNTINTISSNSNSNTVNVPFITQSNLLFDDQQRVMDFVIHTADLSHNSKKFKISYKWTELLMDEFWQQGDTEKKLGVPVSFLCDRNTAEVPKSQLGFIRGIVLPTFEVLIDLLPSLNYLREEIESNLNEWGKIIDEQNANTPKIAKSPRLLMAKTPRMMAKSPRNNMSTGTGGGLTSYLPKNSLLGANLGVNITRTESIHNDNSTNGGGLNLLSVKK